ncbi:unnamed protein product [Didymodactylos carnosus]|uniref:RBR-type E3 ubiquitin transferase n=1 Tax=Didymodactylos carnosus TaxID=1234261 RepID=A0A814M506_9BILA|nr:unnamed protein product [Didymodactylos carnosus]CAF1073330.1 unnamed protein product [Didymodactylos carnosus]CAF3674283.1 unnamed protein product [Didymodactylos carnosus]CAF3840226.1 unnamed protein product [Didymodactylos carnosus]
MCTDVRCPEVNCLIVLSYEAIKKILTSGGRKDVKLFERYDRYALQRRLEKMSEFIWCAHGCGSGQLNSGRGKNYIVKCVKCNRKTCFNHKTEWHEGLTCAEYDEISNGELQATKKWITQNSRKCPNCPYHIEKNSGCDHMTCIKCQYEFCWACLADYKMIRRDGNHRHDPSCKHYAQYN